jgi:hypothetical protein
LVVDLARGQRLLRDVLPQPEWTTDDPVDEFVG